MKNMLKVILTLDTYTENLKSKPYKEGHFDSLNFPLINTFVTFFRIENLLPVF